MADTKRVNPNKKKSATSSAKRKVAGLQTSASLLKENMKNPVDKGVYSLWNMSPAASRKIEEWVTFLEGWFFPGNWEDGEFMDDVRQATLRGANPAANLLFWVILLFMGIMFFWASFAYLDEVTSGQGKVIPSSDVQIVQNLEGGIIQELLVRDGDVVEKGQILMRIDDTGFSSSFGEKQQKLYTLQSEIARLEAQINEEKPVFPQEVMINAPKIVEAQNELYLTEADHVQSTISILQRQVEQKEQELNELKTRAGQARRSYEIAKKELDLTAPLAKEGVVSEVELLRVERQANDLRGEMETSELAIERAESAVREANSRLDEQVLTIRSEKMDELNVKKEELARLSEVMRAVEDQVARTTVRAPVKATVKRVLVNTIGGVVQPGMDLIELIPLEDSLLVQAKIRPADIAFLRPGQEAMVKITAYDYSIYGGLDAHLVRIGADTVVDERGDAYYEIRVRTDKNYLGDLDNPMPIIPGMVASVDILTGKKTVLDYLLKPFNKMREKALRER